MVDGALGAAFDAASNPVRYWATTTVTLAGRSKVPR